MSITAFDTLLTLDEVQSKKYGKARVAKRRDGNFLV